MSDHLASKLLETLRWYARDQYKTGLRPPNKYCFDCQGSGQEKWQHPHNGDWNTSQCKCTMVPNTAKDEYRLDSGGKARLLLTELETYLSEAKAQKQADADAAERYNKLANDAANRVFAKTFNPKKKK